MAEKEISREKEEKELLKLEALQKKEREKRLAEATENAEKAADELQKEFADKDTGASLADINGLSDTPEKMKASAAQTAAESLERGKKKRDIDYDDPKFAFMQYLQNPDASYRREEKKKKMRRAALITSIVLLAVTAIVFISLFFYAQAHNKLVCQNQFHESMTRIAVLLDSAIADETGFDYDTKAREITGELGVVRQMAIFTEENEATQKCLSDLYYASIRMTNQFRLYIPDIREGIGYILDGETDKGYAALNKVIESFDRYDITPEDPYSQDDEAKESN